MKSQGMFLTLLLLALGVLPGNAEALHYYVNAAADEEGADGLAWETAFPDLQQALAEPDVTEVWVAAGTYRPAPPEGNRALSFAWPDGAALYGGFAGDETSRDQRDPMLNETVLCGDLNDNDDQGITSDNSNRIVTVVNKISADNLLDGFTIRGGRADFPTTRDTGAGIFVENGRITVANCVFHDNFAMNNGGAMFVKSGADAPSEVFLSNCHFTNNSSLGFGSAVFTQADNAATQRPVLTIDVCYFDDNAPSYALASNDSNIIMRRSFFTDNPGGAVAARDRVSLTAENCVFMRNSLSGMNGAVYVGTRSDAVLIHCTVAENYIAEITVVAEQYIDTTLDVTNSIVWNDQYPAIDVGAQYPDKAVITVTNTLITGGYAGDGNEDLAPVFRRPDPPGQPNWDSPSIDFCAASELTEDIMGNTRPQNSAFDAGAYEFGQDTDGGGLPDWWEIEHGLDPEDPTDDSEDTDGNGLDNLEEFRRGTDPNNPNDPSGNFYVSVDGDDGMGDGSQETPWRTISWALLNAEEATPTFPVTVYVGEGTFEEQILLQPYTSLQGAGQGVTIIQHYNPSDPESVVIEGAEGAGLFDCTVTFPASVTNVAVLLRILDVSMHCERVTFDGKDQLFTMGAQIYGPGASNTLIRYCIFRRVQYGVQSANAAPVITRCRFQDIRDDAIFIREPDKGLKSGTETPVLGTLTDESTGLNSFEGVDGMFVDNNAEATAAAQMNYYGEEATEQDIADKMGGDVVYTPYVGKSLAAGGIFCAVWDADAGTNVPVTNATATLTQSGLSISVTDNTTGVYAFTPLAEDFYTVTVTAPNFDSATRTTTVSGSELVSLNMPLTPVPMPAVPNLAGKVLTDAEIALTDVGLTLGAVSEQYHNTIPAGQIISQEPAAGAEVPEGTAVAITLSLGPEPVVVPALGGMTQAQAQTALTDVDLILGAVSSQYHATVPEGQVISQSPSSGTEVMPGTAVAVTLSLGPEPPDDVVVPALEGMTVEEAQIALASTGLTLGNVSTQYHATIPAGYVTSQSPGAGAEVAPGASVAITLSLGSEPLDDVVVPNLAGLTEAEAEAALTDVGLVLGAVSSQYHATIPEGQVISQSPSSGMEVMPGTAVAITLSLGPEPNEGESDDIMVPDLAGMTRDEAEAALTAAGLTLGAVSEQYHASIPVGQVISQSPEADAQVPPNTAVAISISLGPRPADTVTVPNLAGLTRDDAEAALAAAGLTLGDVMEQYDTSVPEGQVISQSPEADAQVPLNTAVAISVSLGPRPADTITVPDLAGLTRDEAEAALTAAGLTLGDVMEQYDTSVPEGQVISQSPQADAQVPSDTAVSVSISLGPRPTTTVAVPNLVGMTRDQAQAALDAAGLALGSFRTQYHPSVPVNLIISQLPGAAVLVPPGTAISILVSLGPEQEALTPQEAAELLHEQFDAADANGDGKLNLEEARAVIPSLSEEQFDLIDANEDGYITMEELEAFLDTTPCGCGNNDAKYLQQLMERWLLIGLSIMILLTVSRKR